MSNDELYSAHELLEEFNKTLEHNFDENIAFLFFEHSGVGHDDDPPGRGSGRYPWGSGQHAHQRDFDFVESVNKLKERYKKIYPEATDSEIYKYIASDKYFDDKFINPKTGVVKTSDFKHYLQYHKENVKIDNYSKVKDYMLMSKENGKPYNAEDIAKLMGKPPATIRDWMKKAQTDFETQSYKTAEQLKDIVKRKGMVLVGDGAEYALGVNGNVKDTALARLKDDGYEILYPRVPNITAGPGKKTTLMVLAPKGTTLKDAYRNMESIKTIKDIEEDDFKGALTQCGIRVPVAVDPSRVQINYKENHGTDRDGLIQLRGVLREDGTIGPACPDLSIGNMKYGQVRIRIGEKLYAKGMAVYDTNMPDGVDIIVNSNKSIEKGPEGALKELKVDRHGEFRSNPFGASVVQTEYEDPVTGEKKLSAVNIVGSEGRPNVEGNWEEYKKRMPHQFLEKQERALVESQLKLAKESKMAQFEEIKALTNPVIKQKMLIDFADQCDKDSEDLAAASFPRQKTNVLLPIPSLKDNEVYCPYLENGTTVALVRFPHAGRWEIPILKVNNDNAEANRFLKDSRGFARDAIGINPSVAAILSGADFDGDTAVVIPMSRKNKDGSFDSTVNIKGYADSREVAVKMIGFDPTEAFGPENYPDQLKVGKDGKKHPTYPVADSRQKGMYMGIASNLMTDVQIKGCDSADDLAKLCKLTMVAVDSEKHELNWYDANKQLDVSDLKERYQHSEEPNPITGKTTGPSTLLSRAKSEVDVAERKPWYASKSTIDPETGEKIYIPTDREYKNPKTMYERDPVTNKYLYTVNEKTGKKEKIPLTFIDEHGVVKEQKDWENAEVKRATQKVTQMSLAKDARDLLSSKTSASPIEMAYADYANAMKAMGNKARLEYLATESMPRPTKESKEGYENEIASLQEKVKEVQGNKQIEQRAQVLAWINYQGEKADNPGMSKEELKRLRTQCLDGARQAVDSQHNKIHLTINDREWEAIENGAVGSTLLTKIMNYCDKEDLVARAMPKEGRKLPQARIDAIKALYSQSGYTQEDIAAQFGYSQSYVSQIINEM